MTLTSETPASAVTPTTATDARPLLGSATWVGPHEPLVPPVGERPAHLLACTFEITEDTEQVLVHATAEGLYELFCNGTRVGDEQLTPGFSAYRRRLEVQTADLTALLRPGTNTLVALLSDGWFRGRHGFQRHGDGFGERTALLLRVEQVDAAGTPGHGRTLLISDDGWHSRPSHVLRADLMDGQTIDLSALDPAWFTTEPTAPQWQPVQATGRGAADDVRLVLPSAPPVRAVREVSPVAEAVLDDGTRVLDLGLNLNGWVRLAGRDGGLIAPSGTRVTLTHGEALDAEGRVDTGHLRAFNFATKQLLPAGQVDEVITSGARGEHAEPRHTTHGFRYVQLEGLPREADVDVVGVEVRTDLRETGTFTCDDPRLERLHEVVVNSLRANTCAVPTDCPQRERSGFTGDWQVFVGTAALLADVHAFSRRWLADLRADQWADGKVPTVIPNPAGAQPSGDVFEDMSAGSAGWGDAAVLVPWELWRAYGDAGVLAESLPSMRAWVDGQAERAAAGRHPDRAARRREAAAHERYLLDTGFHFGEWLEPGVAPNPDPRVDHAVVATAFLARSARLLAASCTVLGLTGEAAHYGTLADGATLAWQAEFLGDDDRVAADGTVPGGERQAHYVRALAFGLVPAERRQAVADRLAERVVADGTRLTTGFLATGQLLPALADHGHADLAHALLARTGVPSWLGMVEAGATTMWEWWDGMAPDGSVRGSLDHYSKGAVASFLHTHLAGVRLPEVPGVGEAGYARVRVEPLPGPSLQRASTRLETPYGPLACTWTRDEATFTLTLDLPSGTTADVVLPDGSARTVTGGEHTWECPA
ncbi:alpha-L-rhamnosidase [Nocardioides bruguierae]|uniref:alpha-L-rhamnosidase n=1 Tax=Nocardioides bruguierae TaxID=2945102 RepID=A0A9X2D8S1_9ACTN|nr:alpha-L-rhamnosidase [Nocardioides bruguierae]MCM0621435.1 glycoside hydrolase family 78 protein [Nocardioides bruguierae]